MIVQLDTSLLNLSKNDDKANIESLQINAHKNYHDITSSIIWITSLIASPDLQTDLRKYLHTNFMDRSVMFLVINSLQIPLTNIQAGHAC